jgi:hypothetical protein
MATTLATIGEDAAEWGPRFSVAFQEPSGGAHRSLALMDAHLDLRRRAHGVLWVFFAQILA